MLACPCAAGVTTAEPSEAPAGCGVSENRIRLALRPPGHRATGSAYGSTESHSGPRNKSLMSHKRLQIFRISGWRGLKAHSPPAAPSANPTPHCSGQGRVHRSGTWTLPCPMASNTPAETQCLSSFWSIPANCVSVSYTDTQPQRGGRGGQMGRLPGPGAKEKTAIS